MDLTNQTVSGINEVHLQDSLNASLLKLKVSIEENTVVPIGDYFIVYVDKAPSTNPTMERKQFYFQVLDPLGYYDGAGDDFLYEHKVINNEISLSIVANRRMRSDINGTYVLPEVIVEPLDESIIELFEGENYIYTNYTNAKIDLIYPKNTEFNKLFLNTAIYHKHKQNNVGEFSLDDIYFKDAFTQSGDKLNFEVDNINIDCITSKNNKFSLDSDGNLTVNSITYGGINTQGVLDLIYPIGSIYMSVNNTAPSTLFGGTWERITGYYLYAGNGGTTGGSENSGIPSTDVSGSTAITIAQMPSHTHVQNAHSHTQNANTWMNDPAYYDTRPAGSTGYYQGAGLKSYSTGSTTPTNKNTGGGQGHTHTLSAHTHTVNPLRFEVYMWKRTA